ncbi:MAG TPA: helicase-related protein, partial [Thermoanaerobaculia bacterium]
GEQPQKQALRAGVDLVIATPGRLIDLTDQGFVDYKSIEVAVLDEADRMLDMGFLPAIRKIMQKLPRERQTLMFSATLSSEIEQLTSEFQKTPQVVQIGKRANPAETVTQMVYEVPKSRKIALLLHLLRDQALDSVLVFSRTKHGADKIARKLAQTGIATATLHSNRSQNQRLQALRDFKSSKVRVLVATDIAARGIDVEGISHVVNFDFPPQPEDYVHRIGRTGRAHAIGDAISFVTPDDYGALRALERFITRGIPRVRPADFDYTEQAEDREFNAPRPPRQPQRGRSEARPPRAGGRSGHSSRPSSGSRPDGSRPSHAPRRDGAPYASRQGGGAPPSREARPSSPSRPSVGASRQRRRP